MSEYNHNQMVEWLEERLKRKPLSDKSYDVYRTFEDIPTLRQKLLEGKLPIDLGYSVDLIYVEKIEEEKDEEPGVKEDVFYYTLFLVSTSKITDKKSDEKFGKIKNSFRERLLFYQFYFSRIAEPKSLKIVVVVPQYIDIPFETIEKFFKVYKFGLWKINITKEQEEVITPAEYLRNRMSEEFKISADDPEDVGEMIKAISKNTNVDESQLKEAVKEKAEDFATFFEQYILDSVDAISGIKPEQIGKRYIDKKLIDLVFKLEKVSYSGELRKLVNEHLDEKEDDYLFSRKCFASLWQSNFGETYPKMHEQFEFFLQQFFPRYRDHFIHQLQDFLLGTIILEHLLQKPERWVGDVEIDIKKENLAKGWLLASSIHDFTYPLQKYDEWSKTFFIEQLSIKEPLSFLDLKGVYVEKTFLTRVEHLLSLLGESFVNSLRREDNTRLYNEVRRFFYYGIAEKKNHGLMSASYLLKRFEKRNVEEFSNVILPAAIASAIHDDEIWQILSGQVNGDIKKKWGYIADVLGIEKDIATKILENIDINDEQKDREIADTLRDKKREWIGNIYADISNIITKRPLFELCFEKQPLSFLLNLCDNLQDWGRPCKDEELSEGMKTADIRLKNVTFDVSRFILTIQLFFNDTEQSLGFMAYKMEILKKISNFLKSKTIKFNVEFWDRENDRKKYSYKIGGD